MTSSPPVSCNSSQMHIFTHNAFTSCARQLSSDLKPIGTMSFSSKDEHSCRTLAWTLNSGLHCRHASHVAAGTQLAPSKAVDSPGNCDAVIALIAPSAGPRRPTRSDEPAAITLKLLACTRMPSQPAIMVSPVLERLRHSLPITSGHRPCTKKAPYGTGPVTCPSHGRCVLIEAHSRHDQNGAVKVPLGHQLYRHTPRAEISLTLASHPGPPFA